MERMGRRLNKLIADSGYCSRREADRIIADGRVTIDGRKAVLGDVVGDGSVVKIDGKPIGGDAAHIYIAINKPVGVVCTADPREPMNIVDYLGMKERVYPVGRLDKESEGLLLMTNDGDIVNRLLRAAGGHEREYEVTVDKPLTQQFMEKMQSGVRILGVTTLPCKLRRTGENSFNLILVQGLNRQIRRMCEALGYNVTKLRRVRIMHIRIGKMRPGEFRELTEAEITELKNSI